MNQDGQHGSRSAPVDEVASNRAEANQDSQRSPGSTLADGTVYPIGSKSAEVNLGSAAVDDPRSTGTSKKRKRKRRSESPAASNSAELEADRDGEHGPGSAYADGNVCSAASNSAEVNQDRRLGSGSVPVDKNT